ncbi:MAG: hypothetical protein ABIH92_05000 [Nanoarchaeota archaeon]
MKRKFIVFGSIILVSLLISIASIIILNRGASASPPSATLSECTTHVDNGPDSIKIVFISDEETTQEYLNYLLSIEPFDEKKDKFSFFSINEEGSCKLYRSIALLCNDGNTKKIAAACDHDYVVTVNDKQSKSIRSSSIGKFVSVNRKQAFSVLVHELSHSIFNFAEEYKSAENANPPRGSVNCQDSPEGFEEFEGGYDGTYKECTNSELYRSHENSIMRTLQSNTLGLFNQNRAGEEIERQTSKKISPITGFATQEDSSCLNQEYILVEGKRLEDGTIEITSTEKAIGCAGSPDEFGVLDYTVTSDSNEIILSGKSLPEVIFTTDDSEDTITSPSYENNEFMIAIQETEQADTLEITDEEGRTTTLNLNDIEARPCQV